MSTMKLRRPSAAWFEPTPGEAAPGHAVHDEGRDAQRMQLALPVADVAARPARAVHQDHERPLALALRNRKLAR
jgi:hypothetical protein